VNGSALTIQSDFRYEIVRKIFRAAMGTSRAQQQGARNLSNARDESHSPELRPTKAVHRKIHWRAKLVADLSIPIIVQTYHWANGRGSTFISMEIVHGVNLEQFAHQLSAKTASVPVELAVFITSRIARGLAYAPCQTDDAGKASWQSSIGTSASEHHDRFCRRR